MKLFQKIFILLAVLTITSSNFAGAASTDQSYAPENWKIKSFDSDINLNSDSSADITETIVTDFSSESHRGIERDIPYAFDSGISTPIEFISAKDENGQNWNTNQFEENGNIKIQMTTPDNHQINTGATFVIKYKIHNIITFFSDHDEFYWNINGTDWVVPTDYVSTTIHSPIALTAPNLSCFTGAANSTEQNCKTNQIDDKTIKVFNTQALNNYEGLTAVVGFSKGIFIEPTLSQKITQFISEHKIIFLPIIVLFIMFFIWYKYGRDDKTVSNTIVPTFIPPKGLSPTEVGTIIDEKLDPRDITASIIDLAVKGYIKIKELETKTFFGKKTDYELELIKPYEYEKDFEKHIILGIFLQNKAGQKRLISDLEYKFYKHVPTITNSIMKGLINDDYFPTNPNTIRTAYTSVGIGIIFITIMVMPHGVSTVSSITNMLSMVLCGGIIITFGAIMPHKTKKGTATYYQLKGLYEYINTAEKDRMKFQEDNNILFEKLLPYAMAFGIIEKWSKAFDGIIKNPPSWYTPAQPFSSFNMIYFGTNLSSFTSRATNGLVAKPGGSGNSGFGGGGFSGGGFGGGGGHGL